jgi:CBS domain-containing protein
MGKKLEPPLVSDLIITNVFTVSPDMTLEEVVHLLVEKQIPAAPVVVKKNGGLEVIGIISEKDCIEYLSSEVFYGNPGVTAKNMMERFPLCVSPETDIFSMAVIFTQHPHRHLPVVKKKMLLGFISRRDVLDRLLDFHMKVAKETSAKKSPLDYHELANLRFIIK